MRRILVINGIVLIGLFVTLEVLSGYAIVSKLRFKKLYLLELISMSKIFTRPIISDRLTRVKELRLSGNADVFPSYLYDSQVHPLGSKYWLSNPPNSLIVHCEEGSGMTEFRTNSFGFRKVPNQDLSKPIDLVLIGDSYTEGACVNSPYDIASVIEAKTNSNILNLGRGGTGPLFEFALLKELKEFFGSNNISFTKDARLVWIFFTGNDLENLAEEKSSSLSNYFNEDYTTNYFREIMNINESMRKFYEAVILNPSLNSKISNHGYGETVAVPFSISEQVAIEDLGRLINKAKGVVNSMNLNFSIFVLTNHPSYGTKKQERTQKAIAEGCTQEDVKCTFYSLENKQMKTNHLDELGYNKLSDEIIKSYNLKK